MDYRELLRETLADPDSAFEHALDAKDPVAVALVSFASPGTAPDRAVARFRALASRGEDATTAKLLLGILEHADAVPQGLAEAADAFLRERQEAGNPLPAHTAQMSRMLALVRERSVPDQRRALLLSWLHDRDPDSGRRAALEILADRAEPYDEVAREAISILGRYPEIETRQALASYAWRQLASAPEDPSAPPPQPEAALEVLDALASVSDADLQMAGDVLREAASRGLFCAGRLDRFLGRLRIQQITSLVEQLASQGVSSWLATELVPALVKARPDEMAGISGEAWWPVECLAAFAEIPWEDWDDRLYATVLEQLHRTGHEGPAARIRERAAVRCQNATSAERNQMPRVGIRAFLGLALRGEIPTTDQHLLAALRGVQTPALRAEVDGARWNSPDRARRLGHLLAQIAPELLIEVVGQVIRDRPRTAAGLIEGATPPLLEPHIDALLEAVGDVEAVLAPLCHASETAAARTLQRWRTEQSMAAFRALATSTYSEARLEMVPTAARAYGKHTPAERSEMLEAYGPRGDRVGVLLGILADRTNPPPNRPTPEDLVVALGLLGDHLDMGHEPDGIASAIAAVCREAPQRAVRESAYEALGKAPPTDGVTELLLERRNNEAESIRPSVETALRALADKLDGLASDPAEPTRARAVAQLARIDPPRAAIHARELLSADAAEDRKVAARILGEAGSGEDADRLETAASEEPHLDVRRELLRAVRRLRIGDIAAAHERLGELADVDDPETWNSLDPSQLYGDWKDALITGLDRVAQAEADHHFGTAIDQLDEVAKVLLFRAIEVAGGSIGVSDANRAKAATNKLDYGHVLGWQQIIQSWSWVHHFGSLHGLRTEHVAPRGALTPSPAPTPEDLRTAYSFFRLGARPCLELLVRTISVSSAAQPLK